MSVHVRVCKCNCVECVNIFLCVLVWVCVDFVNLFVCVRLRLCCVLEKCFMKSYHTLRNKHLPRIRNFPIKTFRWVFVKYIFNIILILLKLYEIIIIYFRSRIHAHSHTHKQTVVYFIISLFQPYLCGYAWTPSWTNLGEEFQPIFNCNFWKAYNYYTMS